MRAGIYARISRDAEQDGLGVRRQVADCEALAERRGWTVLDRYIDNDVSATRAKVRPEYERMLAAVHRKDIQAIVVWDVDRLTRSPRELEDVIDMADKYGLALASVGGDFDLGTEQGRMTARMKGTVARYEAEQLARRMRRKLQEKAENGVPHGPPPYGYRRAEKAVQVIVPEQAAIIRECARRALAGETLRSIMADLNERGVPSPRGGKWAGQAVRQFLLRPATAGLRQHQGKIVGKAAWEAILTEDQHRRLVALLTDPERYHGRGSARKHLLTGLLTCGRCGSTNTIVHPGHTATVRGKPQERPETYICRACTRIRRDKVMVEDAVEGALLARLAQPDALAAIASGDPERIAEAREELAGLEARFTESVDLFTEGVLNAADLRRAKAQLEPQIARCRAIIDTSMPDPALLELAGPEVAARWESLALDVKRLIVGRLMTITILPVGSGKRADYSSVKIDWKA